MPSETIQPANEEPPTPGSPVVRRIVVVIALCWLSLLVWMAATSSSSRQLSDEQVLKLHLSDSVITAQIKDAQVVRIIRHWFGVRPTGAISFSDRVKVPDGQFVLMLTEVDSEFVIKHGSVIPATPSTVQQLEQMRAQFDAELEKQQPQIDQLTQDLENALKASNPKN